MNIVLYNYASNPWWDRRWAYKIQWTCNQPTRSRFRIVVGIAKLSKFDKRQTFIPCCHCPICLQDTPKVKNH
jgi:hypothetical protein